MIDREQALKAKRTLAQYCNEHNSDCSECVFAYWYEDGCGDCEFRLYPYPVEWRGVDVNENE